MGNDDASGLDDSAPAPSHQTNLPLFAAVVDKCCRGREANGGAHDVRLAAESGAAVDFSEAAEAVERSWEIRRSDRLGLLMVSSVSYTHLTLPTTPYV